MASFWNQCYHNGSVRAIFCIPGPMDDSDDESSPMELHNIEHHLEVLEADDGGGECTGDMGGNCKFRSRGSLNNTPALKAAPHSRSGGKPCCFCWCCCCTCSWLGQEAQDESSEAQEVNHEIVQTGPPGLSVQARAPPSPIFGCGQHARDDSSEAQEDSQDVIRSGPARVSVQVHAPPSPDFGFGLDAQDETTEDQEIQEIVQAGPPGLSVQDRAPPSPIFGLGREAQDESSEAQEVSQEIVQAGPPDLSVQDRAPPSPIFGFGQEAQGESSEAPEVSKEVVQAGPPGLSVDSQRDPPTPDIGSGQEAQGESSEAQEVSQEVVHAGPPGLSVHTRRDPPTPDFGLAVKANEPGCRNRNESMLQEQENGEEPTPSLEEIRCWGKSFDKLMRSPAGRNVFREFLRCEYSEENILFWLACEELKREGNPDVIEEKARFIYEDYISILSPKEVSLDSRVREVVNRNMVSPTPHTFDEAQLQIYTLMHRDSYPRFVNSPLYRELAQIDDKDPKEETASEAQRSSKT